MTESLIKLQRVEVLITDEFGEPKTIRPVNLFKSISAPMWKKMLKLINKDEATAFEQLCSNMKFNVATEEERNIIETASYGTMVQLATQWISESYTQLDDEVDSLRELRKTSHVQANFDPQGNLAPRVRKNMTPRVDQTPGVSKKETPIKSKETKMQSTESSRAATPAIIIVALFTLIFLLGTASTVVLGVLWLFGVVAWYAPIVSFLVSSAAITLAIFIQAFVSLMNHRS